jgi:hypothetical protein
VTGNDEFVCGELGQVQAGRRRGTAAAYFIALKPLVTQACPKKIFGMFSCVSSMGLIGGWSGDAGAAV